MQAGTCWQGIDHLGASLKPVALAQQVLGQDTGHGSHGPPAVDPLTLSVPADREPLGQRARELGSV